MARIDKLPKRITAEFLAQHEACSSEIRLFEKTFPKGAALTLANARKAERVGLNIHWLVGRVVRLDHDCPLCLEEQKVDADVASVAFDLMKPFIAE